MPSPNPAVLDFLLARRSRPAKTLALPAPSRDELAPILTAAARSPDHGKLEPWRFIVLEKPAMPRLAALADARGAALGLDEERRAKGRGQFEASH
ncbi:MAG: nitroreductase family protein, partial [Cereibacter changlensis]